MTRWRAVRANARERQRTEATVREARGHHARRGTLDERNSPYGRADAERYGEKGSGYGTGPRGHETAYEYDTRGLGPTGGSAPTYPEQPLRDAPSHARRARVGGTARGPRPRRTPALAARRPAGALRRRRHAAPPPWEPSRMPKDRSSVVTSDPTVWAETKDARAKLGPVLVYDPGHLPVPPAGCTGPPPRTAGMVFGREGVYVLANGKILPTLRARSGAPQRWRIVNAAKSRFFLLDLEGQEFYVIGSDGGLQERPLTTDLLLVTPGERVDIIVTPTGSRGGTLTLRADFCTTAAMGSVEYRIP